MKQEIFNTAYNIKYTLYKADFDADMTMVNGDVGYDRVKMLLRKLKTLLPILSSDINSLYYDDPEYGECVEVKNIIEICDDVMNIIP